MNRKRKISRFLHSELFGFLEILLMLLSVLAVIFYEFGIFGL